MFSNLNKIERFAYFDLDLNELAMKQHMILRYLKDKHVSRTIVTITELVKPAVYKYSELIEEARYSLIVIISVYKLNKKEIAQAIEKSQAPPSGVSTYGKKW